MLFHIITSFVYGACIGSFLNVCIYRIPKGRSIVSPGSTCACGHAIAWHDNIPILSWFILRGRARCCGGKFSFRYPFVELLTGLLFVACWMTLPHDRAILAMVLCCLVICAAYIDADTMTIPDLFTVGGAVAGMVLSAAIPAGFFRLGWGVALPLVPSFGNALMGMLVGSAVLLWIAIFSETVLRRETMGGGDVKLMGAIGAFVGWKGAVFSIFGGAVLGVAWLGFCLLFKALTRRDLQFGVKIETPEGQDGDIALGSHISFGPMLGWASVVYALVIAPRLDELTAFWFSKFNG